VSHNFIWINTSSGLRHGYEHRFTMVGTQNISHSVCHFTMRMEDRKNKNGFDACQLREKSATCLLLLTRSMKSMLMKFRIWSIVMTSKSRSRMGFTRYGRTPTTRLVIRLFLQTQLHKVITLGTHDPGPGQDVHLGGRLFPQIRF
jgi:hypothetical protein